MKKTVYYLSMRILRNQADAEDNTIQAFLSLSKTLNRLERDLLCDHNADKEEFLVDGNPCAITRNIDTGQAILYYDSEYAKIEISCVLSDDEISQIAQELRITLKSKWKS